MKASFKYIIPNAITCLNLLSGIIAVVLVLEDHIVLPIFLILAAALFDFLDGFVAKLMHATSAFGKQMDSLADVISFGFAPAALIYKLLYAALIVKNGEVTAIAAMSFGQIALLFSSFIFAIAAALRLARFNIDDEPSVDFKGLPVPAAALFVLAVWAALITSDSGFFQSLFHNWGVLIAINIFLSLLMVSQIPMLSLKFKNYRLRDNLWKYALLIGSVVLFSIGLIDSFIIIMVYYLLLSFAKAAFSRQTIL